MMICVCIVPKIYNASDRLDHNAFMLSHFFGT